MTVNEINARIEQANKNAKALNNERQMKIGQREALNTQIEAALKSYKETYGVELDIKDIPSELQKVSAEKEVELTNIETLIQFIKNNDYTSAQALSDKINGVEVVEEVQEEVHTPEPVVVVEEKLSAPDVTLDTDIDLGDIDLDLDEPITAPAMPEPPVSTPLSTPSEPVGLSLPSLDDLDDLDDLPTPTKPVAPPTNFGSILNGSEFNPGGTL